MDHKAEISMLESRIDDLLEALNRSLMMLDDVFGAVHLRNADDELWFSEVQDEYKKLCEYRDSFDYTTRPDYPDYEQGAY